MKIETQLRPADQELIDRRLRDFVPRRVFDAHAHLIRGDHFAADPLPLVPPGEVLGLKAYREAMSRWLPAEHVDGLFFGYPRPGPDRRAISQWLADELKSSGGNSRALALVSPRDDPADVQGWVSKFGLAGLKPYFVYAPRADTENATIEEFVPPWMWELCHGMRGVLMLHIMLARGIGDERNRASLRRLCRAYPNCRVVLAHVARTYNYRHADEGLGAMRDLENVWVDTSAITALPTLRKAIEVFGPRRVLFGTDYPISDFRGTCVAAGDSYCWINAATLPPGTLPPGGQMTLIGIESLLSLREACEACGLTQGDVQDIFHDNAARLLAPHL